MSEPGSAYRVLARKYRPSTFADLIGQEAMVRTLTNAFATGRIAHAFMLTGVRGVGKTTTARILARALNCIGPDGKGGPTAEPLRRVRAVPRHRRGPPCRRDGDGRRLPHRRRRDPRADRRRALHAGRGALQGLHHRRSAHAVEAGLQRAAEDARRAAAARQVHLRHHRDPQGAGDDAVALPALRPAPRRRRSCWPSITPAIAATERRRGRAGGAGADRPRRRRLGARRPVAARPGDRAWAAATVTEARGARHAGPRRPRPRLRSASKRR